MACSQHLELDEGHLLEVRDELRMIVHEAVLDERAPQHADGLEAPGQDLINETRKTAARRAIRAGLRCRELASRRGLGAQLLFGRDQVLEVRPTDKAVGHPVHLVAGVKRRLERLAPEARKTRPDREDLPSTNSLTCSPSRVYLRVELVDDVVGVLVQAEREVGLRAQHVDFGVEDEARARGSCRRRACPGCGCTRGAQRSSRPARTGCRARRGCSWECGRRPGRLRRN